MMYQFSNFLNPLLTKSIKKNVLFSALLLLSSSIHAKTYYVSNDGDNSNSGTSTSSPWQTVSKINSFSFSAGDIILFRRGDVFRGGIVLKRSNLTLGAYGSGNKPVITGLTTVSGWVDKGSNIWEAPVSNVKKMVNLVLRDGTPQQVGRYPNATASNGGYLTFTSSTSKSITGSANSSTTDWTGAEVVFKANRWTINRQIVTDHSGGTVYFASNPTTPRVNFGYFFQRDARTLDKDGEWFYNSSTSKLRMYFGNDNPNSYDIEIATVDTLFKCQYYDNIEISDLSFEGAGVSSIWFNGGSNVSVSDCDVINSGKEAIVAKSTTSSSVENCTATNNLCTGIDVTDYDPGDVNLLVKNCTVTNTAYIPGMEANNQSGGEGIRCMGGGNVQILYNKVVNSGYIGIKWQGNDVYVKYNYVDRFCTLRDDGAGIYSWEDPANPETRSNRNIISNIVVNGIGNSQGTSDLASTSVQGLYFDIGSKNVVADSNTIAYVANGSFHGNNCGSLTITNNTFFKNGRTYSLQRFADGELIRKVVIKKNILYPYLFRYRNLGINNPAQSKEADMRAFGTIDSNYYCVGPDKDTSLTTVTTNDDNSDYQEDYYGFSYLTQTVGVEKHSTKVDNSGTLEFNASNTARVVNFSGQSRKDVFGKVYNNSVTIPAWGSKILISNGSTDLVNNAPVANAGASKLITLPVNTVTLTGTGTASNGGSITGYSWQKISGPDGPSISTPLLATTIILNLVEGVYEYELTVTDNSGNTGKDAVQVTVNASGDVYLRPASNPSPVTNGLDYKYFEDSFLILPTFNKLTPVKTGTVTNINLDNARRAEHFAFEFTGYISVPSDGVYTFYTNSDDGSKLYIDDALIVGNDGLHGPLEKSGTTGLKAGKHKIRVIYFQRGGGTVLEVSYESNTISKRKIPSSALYRLTNTAARVAAVSNVASSTTLNLVGPVENNAAPVKGDLTISSYPNPSATEFNLAVQGGTNEKIGITVTDASGRVVFETTGVSNKNYNFGNKFITGFYIIKVIQGNNVQTLKVMKL